MDSHRKALADYDPKIERAISGEERRQVDGVEMIPSENYTYPEVLACLGSVLTNKYAEGYPGRRYYGGQEFTDEIERTARQRATKLFRAEYANVQPLSGSPMNQAVYFAFLKPGDTVLAMDLSHGGHLTHGAPVSHMGKVFNFVRYKTFPDQGGAIDFDHLKEVAKQTRPKMVLCGYSSYPRDYDYAAFKAVADEVGALTMADISHIGGLVAAGAMRNPFDSGFDVVTTTTHKTLRGPRGGLILAKKDYQSVIDSAVFPGLQGGPHMNNVAERRGHLQEGGRAGVPHLRRADHGGGGGGAERQGAGGRAYGGGRVADHRRHRQPHDGHGHGEELRHRRTRRPGGSRPHRHHRQQAGDPRRSAAAGAPVGRPARHASVHHPRHGRRRHAAHRRLDRHDVARAG